jgi:hypothetical protein
MKRKLLIAILLVGYMVPASAGVVVGECPRCKFVEPICEFVPWFPGCFN